MLPAYAISRFLALFAHEPVAAAAAATAAASAAPLHSSDMVDETRGGAREGAVGASVLGALCEIRLTDYLRVSARSTFERLLLPCVVLHGLVSSWVCTHASASDRDRPAPPYVP